MKKWLAGVTLAICTVGMAVSQSNSSDDAAGANLLKLEQQWLDAAAAPDLPALRKLISDEFMGTAFGPNILSKTDIVPADGSTANHMPKCSLVNPTVKVFGDTAVLMGNLKPEGASEYGFRVTTVFQKQEQGWRIIAIHMSPAGMGK